MKNLKFNTIILLGILLLLSGCVKSYQITFYVNGGNELSNLSVKEQSKIQIPTPTKTGYTFDGWYSDLQLSTPFSETKMPNHDIDLYAKWSINQYALTFETNGGSILMPITQDYNTTFSINEPIKEYYTFSGWYSDENFTNAYDKTTIPATNMTLYAKWEPNPYTITFITNGGSSVDSITAGYDTVINKPNNPTNGYLTFMGWFKDSQLTNPFNFTTMPHDNITLYAKWAYVPTDGLVYQLSNDQNSYSIIDYTGNEKIIKMPTNYMNLPVLSIGDYVFKNRKITAIVFKPDSSLSSIGKEAFYGTDITTIEIPASVSTIKDGAFANSKLENINFKGDLVTNLSDQLFMNTSLTSIIIPSNVSSIGAKTFYQTNLQTIMIPKNVSTIGLQAFEGDQLLTTINVDFNNHNFISYNGILISHDFTTIIKFPEGITNGYSIPGGITTIAPRALYGSQIYSFAIPLSVTTIGDQAFSNMVNLTQLIFEPQTMPTIGSQTFLNNNIIYVPSSLFNNYAILFSNYVNQLHSNYTIKFESNGGSYINDLVIIDDTTIQSFISPERYGYTFVGWYMDEGLTIPFSNPITSDVTLYAKWEVNPN